MKAYLPSVVCALLAILAFLVRDLTMVVWIAAVGVMATLAAVLLTDRE